MRLEYSRKLQLIRQAYLEETRESILELFLFTASRYLGQEGSSRTENRLR